MAQYEGLGCAKDPSSSTGRTGGALDRDPEVPGPPPRAVEASTHDRCGQPPELRHISSTETGSNKDHTDTSQPHGPQGRGVSRSCFLWIHPRLRKVK